MSLSIDYATILTIIIGNGAVIAVATLLINYYTNKSQKQLEARKEAREYYMTLYGKIAYVEQLIKGTFGAGANDPRQDAGTIVYVKQKGWVNLPKSEAIKLLDQAHDDLYNYYEQKNCEGYGIFVSSKLSELLSEFFETMSSALAVAMESSNKDIPLMDKASASLDDIRKHMEKIFGLK